MMIVLMSDRSAIYERGQVYAIGIGGFDLGLAIAGPVFGSVAESITYRGVFSLAGILVIVALANLAKISPIPSAMLSDEKETSML